MTQVDTNDDTVLVTLFNGDGGSTVLELSTDDYNKVITLFKEEDYPFEVNDILNNAKTIETVAAISTGDEWGIYDNDGNRL